MEASSLNVQDPEQILCRGAPKRLKSFQDKKRTRRCSQCKGTDHDERNCRMKRLLVVKFEYMNNLLMEKNGWFPVHFTYITICRIVCFLSCQHRHRMRRASFHSLGGQTIEGCHNTQCAMPTGSTQQATTETECGKGDVPVYSLGEREKGESGVQSSGLRSICRRLGD
ncbi:hypothetical protein ABZP36_032239 [Zizania latifolia]